MFVEKPKEEVYDVIMNERVLVLVSMDVDSLCACKILQWLFKCDNVQYTIVPVSGKEDLARAFHEHSEQLKHIFMVNCGANLNILEMLEPEEDVMFYIADSHRPIDLDNIYNQDQVKLLMKEGEHLAVPDFDDIYADSEDELEDSDEEGSEPSSKRRRTGDEDSPLSKRKAKRQWRQTGRKFFTSIMRMPSMEVHDKYVTDAQNLHEHVMRHNHGTDENGSSINCLRIVFDTEIPLVQSKQKFYSMDFDLRNNLKGWVETSADRFGLDEMSYGSFHVQYGFKNKLCASDAVYAVNALLEAATEGMTKWDNFLEALDALSRSNTEKLQDGIKMGKKQLIAVVNQVRSLIDMHQVMCAGHFLYAHLREGIPDLEMFSKPAVLGALARFVLSAYVAMIGKIQFLILTFLFCLIYQVQKQESSSSTVCSCSASGFRKRTCLLVGVPPIADESFKNFLGKAFEMAASKTKSRTLHDHFDPAVIEMKSEDRGKFFDALSALLIPK
ncbi:DNA replication initiation factor cdc45 [Desmophyllum pertusum]|uniref:DNA replication initiation factor cdc45 n=1 Tax=Desmophyllum pertusum TaxID=174260 RepID=A0A9W9YJP9_9CNID|nr:DNA replication initiation factor cdc45 [Desmophyllum pertusum]